MACKDCGQAQQQQPGPCRTFTFPLGAGSMELTLRGEITHADRKQLHDFVDFWETMLVSVLPAAPAREVVNG